MELDSCGALSATQYVCNVTHNAKRVYTENMYYRINIIMRALTVENLP